MEHAFYPIDLHQGAGIQQEFIEDGKVPCVYYGNLVPKGSKHILAAGRCLSSDRYANSALRTQAACMAMGQAAGTAAALAVQTGMTVRQVDVGQLRAVLKENGVYL